MEDDELGSFFAEISDLPPADEAALSDKAGEETAVAVEAAEAAAEEEEAEVPAPAPAPAPARQVSYAPQVVAEARPQVILRADPIVLPTPQQAQQAIQLAAQQQQQQQQQQPASSLSGGLSVFLPVTVTTTTTYSSSSSSSSLSSVAVAGGAAAPAKFERKKEVNFVRSAGGETWVDNSLNEWPENDFRLFVGDLGKEVTTEMLSKTFSGYKSFAKAKVVKSKVETKGRGYGFVSFLDPMECARALREMNGKYLGSRPMKLSKSTWKEREITEIRQKEKKKRKIEESLGLN